MPLYTIYPWEVVALSAERLYARIYSRTNISAVEDIYDGNLPKLIEHILVICYVQDIPRTDDDIQIILNAYKQLECVGYIGTGND